MNAAVRIVNDNDTDCVGPIASEESSDREVSERKNRQGPSPVLHYTNRLRDFLISRRYEIEPSSTYHLCEAEFKTVDSQEPRREQKAVPQGTDRKRKSSDEPLAADDESNSDSIVFPQAFHFHLFWWGFDRSKHPQLHIYPQGTGIHPRVQDRQTIRSGPVINDLFRNPSLIWLSPSIFISTIQMSWASAKTGKYTPLWMYSITLEARSRIEGTGSFHIYCIEYFQKYKRNKPSSPRLPLMFFRQMLPRLSVDCFTTIEFTRQAAIDCEGFFSQFLSCVLPSAKDVHPPYKAKNHQEYTEVRFAGKINALELEAILNHRFHPYVRLAFDHSDDTSLDPKTFNYLLRHASDHVRHLKIPKFLIKFLPSEHDDESFTANPRLETLTIDWTNIQGSLVSSRRDFRSITDVSPDLLQGIKRNPNFQRLNLRFDAPIYRIQGTMIHYFINDSVFQLMEEVIPGHRSFKELTVEAKLTAKGVPRAGSGRFFDYLVSSSKSFPSSLTHLSFQYIGRGVAEDRRRKISSIWWDSHVIPRLAMNWLFHQSHAERRHEAPSWAFSKKATQRTNRTGVQPAASLLALKIRAINEGILYRKTTEHLPRDTRTTNASVIAPLLRMAMGEMVPAL
jgi:hypothetical protein